MTLLTFFTFVTSFLLSILMLASLGLSEYNHFIFHREELSSYECGFEHNSLSRVPFSLRYFLLTILFLVFDLEISLLLFLPYSVMVGSSSSYIMINGFFFLIFLLLGLLYEWSDGSLDWVL